MFLLLIVVSYFLGAIPVGVIISKKYYGMDIRQHGSGNPGATNVWRVLGAKPGIATLLLDGLKGAAGIILAKILIPNEVGSQIACGIAAILGHNWSVFLKGSGGKGVATSAGVFLALMPFHTLIALAVFLGFFLTTKHVSVGSMAAAVALFVATFFIRTPAILQALVFVASALVLVQHVPNMKRLARGEEPKVNIHVP
jgi:acyl phosphate:glycerol-3-phosphate acyltransferase